MKKIPWGAVVVVVLAVLVLTYVFIARNGSKNFQEQLHQNYQVGSIVDVSVGSRTALFEITDIYAFGVGLSAGSKHVFFDGILHIEAPEGAEYLGTTKGSLVINWQYEDGSGETWFLYNPSLINSEFKAMYSLDVLEIVVTK